MIRDRKWRLGFLLGVLVLLWAFIYEPVLILVGIFPKDPAALAAGIGAPLFFLVPFGLMEFLMVLLVFFRRTRLLSFGLPFRSWCSK